MWPVLLMQMWASANETLCTSVPVYLCKCVPCMWTCVLQYLRTSVPAYLCKCLFLHIYLTACELSYLCTWSHVDLSTSLHAPQHLCTSAPLHMHLCIPAPAGVRHDLPHLLHRHGLEPQQDLPRSSWLRSLEKTWWSWFFLFFIILFKLVYQYSILNQFLHDVIFTGFAGPAPVASQHGKKKKWAARALAGPCCWCDFDLDECSSCVSTKMCFTELCNSTMHMIPCGFSLQCRWAFWSIMSDIFVLWFLLPLPFVPIVCEKKKKNNFYFFCYLIVLPCFRW